MALSPRSRFTVGYLSFAYALRIFGATTLSKRGGQGYLRRHEAAFKGLEDDERNGMRNGYDRSHASLFFFFLFCFFLKIRDFKTIFHRETHNNILLQSSTTVKNILNNFTSNFKSLAPNHDFQILTFQGN